MSIKFSIGHLVLALAVLMLAMPAVASSKGNTETVMRNGEKVKIQRKTKNGVEMVCEIRKPVGSNLRKKVCMPADEYAEHEQAAEDYLNDAFNNGYGYHGGS